MAKIIITGTKGYVANAIKSWYERKRPEVQVELLDVRGDEWKAKSFEGVEAVVHTAALVHKNEKEHALSEYHKVNVELTEELAEKAKKAGVRQFVFFSTLAVYGLEGSCFKNIEITKRTPLEPVTKYGITKLKAEGILRSMETEQFIVTIVRPPIIYGAGCPGNYQKLRSLTLKYGIIPKIKNKRGMLYIEFLCEMVAALISQRRTGTFCLQNPEPVCTTELAKEIAICNGKKVFCSCLAGKAVKVGSLFLGVLKKAFGTQYYSQELTDEVRLILENVERDAKYGSMNLAETVCETEK